LIRQSTGEVLHAGVHRFETCTAHHGTNANSSVSGTRAAL
jgi:hypothetical protein